MAGAFGKRQPQTMAPLIEMIAAAVPWHMDRMKVRRGVELAAGAMIGFGIILWIAAHWSDMPRFTRFGLVGAALAVSVAASCFDRIRLPALIAAFLATGGLFALVGQTYQTGADPWQLFAVWALVTLPWAVVPRHDAMWLGWAAVVTTGLALWQATFAGRWFAGSEPAPVLTVWLIMAGMALAFAPWDGLVRWRGATRWTSRLVVLLLLASLVHNGLADVFAGGRAGGIYFASLLLLAVIAVLVHNCEPFDFAILALTGLAADVLLIGGAVRVLFQSSRDLIGGMFMLGLVSVAIVGATGSGLMAIARDRIEATGSIGARFSTWPAVLSTGIGATIASIPVIAFLSLFIGPFVLAGIGTFFIGCMAVVAGCALLRMSSPTQFLHQVGVIALMMGLGLLAFAIFRDARGQVAAPSFLMVLLVTGIAFTVSGTWVTGLLGGVAAIFLSFSLTPLLAWEPGSAVYLSPAASAWSLIIAAGAAWFAWQSTWEQQTIDDAGPLLREADRFIGGAIGTALLAVVASAGPTFLVGGGTRLGGLPHMASALPFGWQSLSLFSALLAAAGAAWYLVPRPAMQTLLGFTTAAVVIALSVAIPGLGALVLLFPVAAPANRKVFATGALVAATWLIGAFYYGLAWPLQNKAVLMVACGLVLTIASLLAGERPAAGAPPRTIDETTRPLAAFALIAAGALAAAGLTGQSILAMEAILAHGETAYLALAPVDPRSLVQGDYMALNFDVPMRDARRNPPRPGERLWATATLDHRRVATITALSALKPATSAGQLLFELKAKGNRWVVGTDAWFFKEGTAKKWQAARFGEFRVSGDGRALLVDLADRDLKSLK